MTVALTGLLLREDRRDLTSGANPATTAPGDTLRYTLRFRTFDEALSNFRIFDELDALNPLPVFVPGLAHARHGSRPAPTSATPAPTAARNGGGVIDIRNLNVPIGGEVLIQFDVTLAATLANGTVVTNQSTLLRSRRHRRSR